MNKFIKLAWRNLWRNRRRSIITLSAIAFAVFVIGITRSMQYGTYDALEASAVRLFSGDLQIQGKAFLDERTLSNSFSEDNIDWQVFTAEREHVLNYAKRITSFGLVSSDSASAGGMIIGIQPEEEARVTKFSKAVSSGEPLSATSDHTVVLGKTLAENLQLGLGDEVVLLTQGYRNEMGADIYTIGGLVQSGSLELDRALVLMTLWDARDLFMMHGRLSQIVCRTDDFREAESIAKSLESQIGHEQIVAHAWPKLMPELLQMILWDNVSGLIFLLFLVIVVGFEVLNTSLMSILERVREFGVMQALGVKPKELTVTIFFESLFKIVIGILAGLLLTFVLISSLEGVGIQLTGDMEKMMQAWGFTTEIFFSPKLKVYLEPALGIFLISLISIIYPIWMASRLTPLEAIRQGK